MKVCAKCGEEISGKDGDNLCPACDMQDALDAPRKARVKANRSRRARDQAMRDLGLVRVRGNCGGVYWE